MSDDVRLDVGLKRHLKRKHSVSLFSLFFLSNLPSSLCADFPSILMLAPLRVIQVQPFVVCQSQRPRKASRSCGQDGSCQVKSSYHNFVPAPSFCLRRCLTDPLEFLRTRTNTNPNDTEANAAGRSGNARALRKQNKCGVIHEGEGHWPIFS